MVWLTCRRDTRDSKVIIARKFADFGLRTDADGGQVQPVLGSFRPVVSPFGYDCWKRFIS